MDEKRKEKGAYTNSIKELPIEDTGAFKDFVHMSYEQFKEFVSIIEPEILKKKMLLCKMPYHFQK